MSGMPRRWSLGCFSHSPLVQGVCLVVKDFRLVGCLWLGWSLVSASASSITASSTALQPVNLQHQQQFAECLHIHQQQSCLPVTMICWASELLSLKLPAADISLGVQEDTNLLLSASADTMLVCTCTDLFTCTVSTHILVSYSLMLCRPAGMVRVEWSSCCPRCVLLMYPATPSCRMRSGWAKCSMQLGPVMQPQ